MLTGSGLPLLVAAANVSLAVERQPESCRAQHAARVLLPDGGTARVAAVPRGAAAEPSTPSDVRRAELVRATGAERWAT